MFSEEAKRELKELARSAKLREDCEQLRLAVLRHPLTLDEFVQFLTDMTRVFPTSQPSSLVVPYTTVRI
jgi:hypothetical protein